MKQKYKRKGIQIKFGREILPSLVNLSDYREFGARRISKLIKDKIENQMMEDILNHKECITITKIKEEATV